MEWSADIVIGLIVNLLGLVLTGSTILYRIRKLEEKVEKHNHFMERIAVLECDVKSQWHQINDLKSERIKS